MYKSQRNFIKSFPGGDAAINQFPWLALIEHNGKPTCTGVIISSRHVLTAAQCLYQSP